jgi:hypothetical protein
MSWLQSETAKPQDSFQSSSNAFIVFETQFPDGCRRASMRLLDARTHRLVDFPADSIPRYAILSHRWGATDEEVLFADVQAKSPRVPKRKPGWQKVHDTCQQALDDGYQYVWIDTCTIDKTSSAELSEAINSMFVFYQRAAVCYAYLSDVQADRSNPYGLERELPRSKWFTRGWTLQELLAPSNMHFFNYKWQLIGTKTSLKETLSKITGISPGILNGQFPIGSASIAQRMSWAALRKTTRPEDIAYCLMGMFSVHMPLLYGEGERAFLRLQEEIMKSSDDHTLFAWADPNAKDDDRFGLLAKHPSLFKGCGYLIPRVGAHPPYSMTNRGLQITLSLRTDRNEIRAALDCPHPDKMKKNTTSIGIYVAKISTEGNQYARVKASALAVIPHIARGPYETLHVRQDIQMSDFTSPYVLQLRQGPSPEDFEATEIVTEDGSLDLQPSLRFANQSVPRWLRNHGTWTFPIPLESGQMACAIVFRPLRFLPESKPARLIVVMLGSTGARDAEQVTDDQPIQVAWCVQDLDHEVFSRMGGFIGVERLYKPTDVGQRVWLQEDYVIHVNAERWDYDGLTHYAIDIELSRAFELGGVGVPMELSAEPAAEGFDWADAREFPITPPPSKTPRMSLITEPRSMQVPSVSSTTPSRASQTAAEEPPDDGQPDGQDSQEDITETSIVTKSSSRSECIAM